MGSGFRKVIQRWKKILPAYVISFGILLLGFILCRYAFFDLHGMKEWPVNLLIAGIVALLISLVVKKQYMPWFISIGYSAGFWLGVLFHTEGYDPGGGKTDNLWGIWAVVFLVCILAGAVFEIIKKWQKLLKKN